MGAVPTTISQTEVNNNCQGIKMEYMQLLAFYNLDTQNQQSCLTSRVNSQTTVADIMKALQLMIGVRKISLFINSEEYKGDPNIRIFQHINSFPHRKFGYRVNKTENFTSNNNSNNPKSKTEKIYIQPQQEQNSIMNINSSNQSQQKKTEQISKEVQFNQNQSRDNDEQRLINSCPEIDRLKKKISQSEFRQSNLFSENENLKKQLVEMQEQMRKQNDKVKELEDRIKQCQLCNHQINTQIITPENQMKQIKSDSIIGNFSNHINKQSILMENQTMITFESGCKHKLSSEQLCEILANAINKGCSAKCMECDQKIPNSDCLTLSIGNIYINSVLTNQANQLYYLLGQPKFIIARCSSKACAFFCIWDFQSVIKTGYCPSCLSLSIQPAVGK